MHIKTALVAVATATGVAAQSDYGDFLSSAYGSISVPVVVSTAGKSDTRTTYVVHCAPGLTTRSDYNGCFVGDGVTVVKGQGVIDMETVSGEMYVGQFLYATISQHCTYSGTSDPECTISRLGPHSTSVFTASVAASDVGAGGMVPSGAASTKASPTPNTATATSTASSSESASNAEHSATRATGNAGMPQATGNAWAVGGAVMALALAVA